MAKPYSADLRMRVAAAIAEGETCRAPAERFEIALTSPIHVSPSGRTSTVLAYGRVEPTL